MAKCSKGNPYNYNVECHAVHSLYALTKNVCYTIKVSTLISAAKWLLLH